jgi:catechol 2,3-dioxygenase-like lactoylglutathione lyase family enzyme
MKFTHVRIVSKDVPRLVSFYHDITGIDPVVGSDDYVELRTNAGTLAICSQRSIDLYGAHAAVAENNRSAIIEFRVDDVDLERSRLDRFVPEFALEPTTQPWGNRSMLFRDPDGNLINFFAPV